MEYRVFYLGIEKVVYKFTEYDIEKALMEKHKIKRGSDSQFSLYGGDEDSDPYAELVVEYTNSVKEADLGD